MVARFVCGFDGFTGSIFSNLRACLKLHPVALRLFGVIHSYFMPSSLTIVLHDAQLFLNGAHIFVNATRIFLHDARIFLHVVRISVNDARFCQRW